ncbi:conserved domain protein, putative [Acidithiobacillus sp. GGI-221]|nr:conserved domain protein, putative [Acidithiobacillus sp. GGI-221]
MQLVITNNSYNPADSTGKINYGINIPLTVPNGGNYGTQLNMNDVFGGNNCSQNFDWYPSFGITGEDVNGTFNGTITFGNYLSPSQYAQSPTFPVVFQNYKTGIGADLQAIRAHVHRMPDAAPSIPT